MYIGLSLFKPSTILHDVARERVEGGTIYDGDRVAALVDIWHMLCNQYCKPPLMPDFCSFAGLSWSWLYDNNGQGTMLTSARSCVLQKLHKIQEAGIATRLVDGKGSPVGQIFFLKNNHGWKDQRETVHVTASNDTQAAALPMFDGET